MPPTGTDSAAAPVVSAIVVNYGRADLLAACLESLLAAGGDPEVIVVDNGSTDGSAAMVRERFPGVRLLELETNRGFAGGVAAGVAAARGDWLALINNDATVAPDALERMLEAGRSDPGVGAVAAQMRFADRPGMINSAGIEVDRLGVAADRLLGAPAEPPGPPVEVFGASGGAVLYRRRMLDEIGGFDPGFFAYYEDVDVAWRARQRGWRCLYAPAAVVWHHHSATGGHGSPFKWRLVGRNRVRVLARNATARQLRRYAVAMVAYDLAYVAYVAVRHRSLAPLSGRLAGLRDWRRYRRLGSAHRTDVPLAPVMGLRRALGRNRTWNA